MQHHFKKPIYPLLVYTDLDGTLLDHDSYSFQPALPALKRLTSLSVPVIPVTSKTLAELKVLTKELGLHGPCIAENGGLIGVPRDYFNTDISLEHYEDFDIEYLSPDYASIVNMLNELRQDFGFHFEGFANLTAADVAGLTGLSIEEAGRAKQRLCSEPLVWRDSDEAFTQFQHELDKRKMTLVEGGRFHHVLGSTDKAMAMEKLSEFFSQAGFSDVTSIALGDSPNDRRMLTAADVAVVIRRKDGTWLELDTAAQKVKTEFSGPQGWNAFFQDYLDRFDLSDKTNREIHG